MVLALGAVVMGGLVVSVGSLSRNQPRVASAVSVPVGAARNSSWYGKAGASRDVCVAPHYGAVAEAELLREQFNTDIISATAVFCLGRDENVDNTWRPATIPYDPTEHGELDTPQKFREHVISAAGVSPSLYSSYRNPLNLASNPTPPNASIFVLGYSDTPNKLRVIALYEIDVIRITSSTQPQGFYSSVRRYSRDPRGLGYPLAYAGGYEVFFTPSVPNATSATQWSKDGFTPLFVTFERSTRRAFLETPDSLNRFKAAAERPFYFVWWPDPAARHLGAQPNTLAPSDPRQAYNHMGGRTAFMFTVPMFPAL